MGIGVSPCLGGLPGPLLRDTFTGADGTNLTAHTMEKGAGWTVTCPFRIQSSRCQKNATTNTSAAFGDIIHADAGASNGTVQGDIILAGSGSWTLGLALRVTDINNCWLLAAGLSALDKFEISEVSAGTSVIRASATFAFVAGQSYTFKAVLSGQTITGYINGVQQLQYASAASNQSATRMGLVCYYDGATWLSRDFDNFLVTP